MKKKLGKKGDTVPKASAEGSAPVGAAPAASKTAAPKKAKPTAGISMQAPSVRGGLPFICSECYEEFRVPSSYQAETVTCPECMHVGKRNDEDFMRRVSVQKASERSSLRLALTFASLFLVLALAFFWLQTPYSASVVKAAQRGTFVPLIGGLALVNLVALIWAAGRYEKNRWEIYF